MELKPGFGELRKFIMIYTTVPKRRSSAGIKGGSLDWDQTLDAAGLRKPAMNCKKEAVELLKPKGISLRSLRPGQKETRKKILQRDQGLAELHGSEGTKGELGLEVLDKSELDASRRSEAEGPKETTFCRT